MNRRGLFGSICVLPFLSIFKKKFEYRDKHLGKVKEFKVEEDLTLNSNYLWFPVEAIVCVKYEFGAKFWFCFNYPTNLLLDLNVDTWFSVPEKQKDNFQIIKTINNYNFILGKIQYTGNVESGLETIVDDNPHFNVGKA